jgi:hypothetical protein
MAVLSSLPGGWRPFGIAGTCTNLLFVIDRPDHGRKLQLVDKAAIASRKSLPGESRWMIATLSAVD